MKERPPITSRASSGDTLLTVEEYRRFGQAINARTGIYLSEERQPDVELKLADLLAAFPPGGDLAARVSESTEFQRQVLDRITVGESYFFRNRPHFAALKEMVLPELIAAKRALRRLRIWCAGCATGEEPYSIAILLKESFPELDNWNIDLHATDINRTFLDQARAGIYGDWSFRHTAPTLRERHFVRLSEGRYRIRPELSESVTFRRLNLAAPSFRETYAEDFDLILCRNVLIYFDPVMANQTVRALTDVLCTKGVLITGHAETFAPLRNLQTVYGHSTFFFRRTDESDLATSASRPGSRPRIPGDRVTASAQFDASTFSYRPRPSRAELEANATVTPEPGSAEGRLRSTGGADDLIKRARASADLGDLDTALALLHRIPERSRNIDHRVHFLMALVAAQTGHPKDAMTSLRRAVFLKQDFAAAHYYLGILTEREGDRPAAQRYFTNATNLLEPLAANQELEESGGLTAGRLLEICIERKREMLVYLNSGERHDR